LEEHLDLLLSILLDSCDLTLILDGRRRRDKRKGLDIFFTRRELISLRDHFDTAARGAVHAAIATVMKHIVIQHQKLFAGAEVSSALDYGKIDDREFWLEEAQCITSGDHVVELKGADRDNKAVSDWEKRARKSCEKQKAAFCQIALDRFDDWSSRVMTEQQTICEASAKRLTKKIKKDEKELQRINSEEVGPNRVASLKKRLERKKARTDKLFQVYMADVFENSVKYYV